MFIPLFLLLKIDIFIYYNRQIYIVITPYVLLGEVELMQKETHWDRFRKDNNAISEEFTALPALSVVLIGFTLFVILIANTYGAYESRIESLEKYQTADFIATKLTNPDCFFINGDKTVNLPLLENSGDKLNESRDQYRVSGFDFIVRIDWTGNPNGPEDFPEKLEKTLGNNVDHIAISRDVGVYLNPANTSIGKLTIILWSV